MSLSKPVQVPPVKVSNEPSGSNKTLLILGGLAVLSIGGFVAYKFLTKEEKKDVGKVVLTPGKDEVKVVVDRATPQSSQQVLGAAPDSNETTRDSSTYSKNSATTDYTTWRIWAEPRLGLKFKHPSQYTIKMTHPNSDTTLVEMNSPLTQTDDKVQVYIMCEDQPHHVDIREYMNMCLVPVQNYVGKIDKEVDRDVLVNGQQGYEFEYTASKGDRSIRMWSVGASVGNKTFVFQLTAPKSDTTINNEEILNIIKSFEFVRVPYNGASRVRTSSGLEIDLPNIGYLITPTNDSDVILHAVAHSSTQVQSSITITKKPATVFDTFISDLEGTVPNAKRIPSSLTILGTPVIVHQYSNMIQDSQIMFIKLCFKHNNISYIVEASNLLSTYDNFERQLFTSLAGTTFNNNNNLMKDVIKYSNRQESFSIEIPANNTIVKEHSFQTIASFMVIPQAQIENTNSVLLMETAINAINISLPKDSNEALSKISSSVKSTLDEQSSKHDYTILSESIVQIGNLKAVRFLYRQSEILSQANLIFYLTCFGRGDKGYISVKSYTLDNLYDQEIEKTFEHIHSTFKFL